MAERETGERERLNTQRVLRAGVALADGSGLNALSMRSLADSLGVVPMALYKHVANKRDLLDGMVDLVWAEVIEPSAERGWKPAMRERAVSLRDAMTRHRWAVGLMEAHGNPGPHNLRQHNAMMGCLRENGFSFRTTVHVTSALDAYVYVYGFALQQKTLSFETPEESAEVAAATAEAQAIEAAALYPYLLEVVVELASSGYNYDEEFVIGLDVLLDGIDVLRTPWRNEPGAPERD